MITDKEKLDAPYMPSALLCDIRKRKDGHWCWSNKKALDKIYERDRFIRAESAERARKEAAERVACAWREHGEGITLRILRDAILDDTVKEGKTDAEKLDIAVKALKWALEYIGDGMLPDEGTPDHECGYTTAPDNGHCEFCENYWNAREALKEIQG